MLARDRKELILEDLKQNNIITVEVLANKYNVSEATIRRDLNDLENKKLLNRIHGGATSLELITQEPDYLHRKAEHTEIKSTLAKRAADLVHDNMIVFFDAGTSVFEVAKIIIERDLSNLTLITNDINTAYLIYKSKKHRLILVGGSVYIGDGHVQGPLSNNFMNDINPEIAFLGTSSIDDNYYLCSPDENKIFQKRILINNANKKVLVTDASKFGKKSIFKIANIDEIDFLITDYKFSTDQLKKFSNLKVIYVDK